MPRSDAQLLDELEALTKEGVRDRLLARGLARSLIWRDGVLPEDAPPFARDLTHQLLSHGFNILQNVIALSPHGRDSSLVREAFRIAGETIEAVIRRGDPQDPDRGFLAVAAAASYQLARLAARSYVVLPPNLGDQPLSIAERLLSYFLRRDLKNVFSTLSEWTQSAEQRSTELTTGLEQQLSALQPDHDTGEPPLTTQLDADGPEDPGLTDTAISWLLTDHYVRAVSHLAIALRFDDNVVLGEALERLRTGKEAAADAHHVPLWWTFSLTLLIADDLWSTSLWRLIPVLGGDSPSYDEWNQLRRKFIATKIGQPKPEFELWPSQYEAATRSALHSDSFVAALPTSAGKTRIAELCILRALSMGKRAFYVTPLRALSAQVERILGVSFGTLGYSVTSLYGASGVSSLDITLAGEATVVVATPEKLDYVLRNDPGSLDDVGCIVLDEGHMIGMGTREIRYEMLVQRLLRRNDAAARRIVCLSAVFDSGPSFDDFCRWMASGVEGAGIHSQWRPTRQRPASCVWQGKSGARLQFYVDEDPFIQAYVLPKRVKGRRKKLLPSDGNELTAAVAERLVSEKHTVLIYCPMRRSVESFAKKVVSLLDKDALSFPVPPTEVIQRALDIGAEWLGAEHIVVVALSKGLAIHHGALPRPFLSEVERLINARAVQVVVASPTLAQGLDLSCSALVFQSLYRSGYVIPANEFRNVIGRVGRAFVDIDGISIYPIHETDSSKVKRKIREFRTLWSSTKQATLESGLKQLVAVLIDRLSRALRLSASEMIDRVSAVDFDWTVVVSLIRDAERGEMLENVRRPQDWQSIDALIARLDEALLGAIDPEKSTEDLAVALDELLKGSFWQRCLTRVDNKEDLGVQTGILVGRARWLWAQTDAATRRGLSVAGIGMSAANSLLHKLNELVVALRSANEALNALDPIKASQALNPVIEFLSTVPPFDFELPENWQQNLSRWMSSEAVLSDSGLATEEALEFVSDGLVYRTVWGIEAIRTLALTKGLVDIDFDVSSLSESLTFGCYEPFGRWLLRKGLGSRHAALAVTELARSQGLLGYKPYRVLSELIENDPVSWALSNDPAQLRQWQSFLEIRPMEQVVAWSQGAWTVKLGEESISRYGGIDTKAQLVTKPDGNTALYSADLDWICDLEMPSARFLEGLLKVKVSASGVAEINRLGPGLDT